MDKLEQIFDKVLKESVYSFNINPSERSWFIKYGGQKLGNNSSHLQLLKKSFPEDWEIYVEELSREENKDKTDPLIEAQAEKTFSHRLLKTGWVKIGEIGGSFYLDSYNSGKEITDIASSFAKSLLKIRENIENKDFYINNVITGINLKYSVIQIAEFSDI